MSTTLTRSTNSITRFVESSQELAAIELKRKELLRIQDETRNEVLQQIGEERTVKVNGAIVTLTPRVSDSFKCIDDEATLEFAKSHPQILKVSTRTPEYVAPSSFRSACMKNGIPAELFVKTTTIDVNVI